MLTSVINVFIQKRIYFINNKYIVIIVQPSRVIPYSKKYVMSDMKKFLKNQNCVSLLLLLVVLFDF